MSHSSARALAGALAAGVLLAGCSSDPGAVAPTGSGTSASASASATNEPSASTSPSPSSTLTAEEQQAFEEATEVVLAYRQTITDLYSGARTNLNDLNSVAAGDLRDQGLKNIQQSLSDGWRYEPSGARVELAFAEPVDVKTRNNPERVTLIACIDTTGITGVDPEGERTPGVREALKYTVTRAPYLPAPSWAVTQVSTAANSAEDRSC